LEGSDVSDPITLYFDESGQTGTKLLDSDQKFFSVGSTDLDDAEARNILREHFPKLVGIDIKFRKLFRRSGHRRGLIEFARTVSHQPGRFFCYLADKRFAALAKLVDWSVEPLLTDQGYDWYRNDYGRRWVNMFWFAVTQATDPSYLDEITTLYGAFSDCPSRATFLAMQRRYAELAERGPEALQPFMALVADGVSEFPRRYNFSDFDNRNDIHVTCVVTSVAWWRARHSADFHVIHDQSKHFFQRQDMWARVTDMSASEGVVQVGDKTIPFPLRVRSTREGDSGLLASLQICDLIGGFVARTRSARLTQDERKLIDNMLAAGMGEVQFQSIEPGQEFVDGPPARRNGPDAVDQVAMLTARRPASHTSR
jgi:hypothetical protein